MVKRRKEDKITAAEQQLAAKKLREVTTQINALKKRYPTIRAAARRTAKRWLNSTLLMPSYSKHPPSTISQHGFYAPAASSTNCEASSRRALKAINSRLTASRWHSTISTNINKLTVVALQLEIQRKINLCTLLCRNKLLAEPYNTQGDNTQEENNIQER